MGVSVFHVVALCINEVICNADGVEAKDLPKAKAANTQFAPSDEGEHHELTDSMIPGLANLTSVSHFWKLWNNNRAGEGLKPVKIYLESHIPSCHPLYKNSRHWRLIAEHIKRISDADGVSVGCKIGELDRQWSKSNKSVRMFLFSITGIKAK